MHMIYIGGTGTEPGRLRLDNYASIHCSEAMIVWIGSWSRAVDEHVRAERAASSRQTGAKKLRVK